MLDEAAGDERRGHRSGVYRRPKSHEKYIAQVYLAMQVLSQGDVVTSVLIAGAERLTAGKASFVPGATPVLRALAATVAVNVAGPMIRERLPLPQVPEQLRRVAMFVAADALGRMLTGGKASEAASVSNILGVAAGQFLGDQIDDMLPEIIPGLSKRQKKAVDASLAKGLHAQRAVAAVKAPLTPSGV